MVKKLSSIIMVLGFMLVLFCNVSFAQHQIYLPYDLTSENKEHILVKVDGEDFDQITGVGLVIAKEIVPVHSFSKLVVDGEHYLKIQFQKMLGLQEINQIKLKINGESKLIDVGRIVLEGLKNVNASILHQVYGRFTDKTTTITYKNISAETVKIFGLGIALDNVLVELYENDSQSWVKQRTSLLGSGQEVTFRITFQASDQLEYFIKPVLRYEYQGKNLCHIEMYELTFPLQ